MEAKRIKKFRWFWAWEDEKEEAWLRAMSNQGWHLVQATLPGWYTFQRGESVDYVYRLDFITTHERNEEYYNLFRDAGWEHLGEMSSWQYFRIQAQDGGSPEIYTDPESKVGKYRRVASFLLIFIPILTINVINLTRIEEYPWLLPFRLFNLFMLLFFLYALYKLYRRMTTLKRL